MTKTQLTPLTTTEPVLSGQEYFFDADADNTVYFPREYKGKEYRVGHRFSALSDARYFQYQEEAAGSLKKLTQLGGITTEGVKPQVKLWDELAVERIGYKESADWKEKTHLLDKSNAVRLLLLINIPEQEQSKADENDLLDDEDETTVIPLDVYQNGVLIGTNHTFRQEMQSELDEYLAIEVNLPPKGQLASASRKKSGGERLCDLYDAVCTNQTGYSSSRIPAWHKERVTAEFFKRELARLGKSLN